MLEYFVHIDPDDPPRDLVLVAADIPASVSRTSLSTKQLPPHWRANPPPPELAGIGDHFVRDGRRAILIVPSAVAVTETNWLINPRHADSRRIRVLPAEPFAYDERLLR